MCFFISSTWLMWISLLGRWLCKEERRRKKEEGRRKEKEGVSYISMNGLHAVRVVRGS